MKDYFPYTYKVNFCVFLHIYCYREKLRYEHFAHVRLGLDLNTFKRSSPIPKFTEDLIKKFTRYILWEITDTQISELKKTGMIDVEIRNIHDKLVLWREVTNLSMKELAAGAKIQGSKFLYFHHGVGSSFGYDEAKRICEFTKDFVKIEDFNFKNQFVKSEEKLNEAGATVN